MMNVTPTIRGALLFAFVCSLQAQSPASREAEIVIYGGNAGGVAAGIQAKRMGRDVLVIEPSAHLGGLTTGGLGQTDIGNKHVIGGIAREFYRGIRDYYARPEGWKWQKREEYRDGGQTRTEADEDTMWTFEPSAAKAVLRAMIDKAGLEVVTGERLDRTNGVVKEGARIAAIRFESGMEVRGKIFIDATYEGDLLAAAGVRYRVGRESNREYGETLNGVQADRWARQLSWRLSLNAENHQLADGVDPYRIPGDRSSGVLPGIRDGGPGIEGSGDAGVQAYCFRACLTDHPENRIPFPKPEDYDEIDYELLLRHLEADPNAQLWINSAMPNRKTDTNNGGGFSGDFIGGESCVSGSQLRGAGGDRGGAPVVSARLVLDAGESSAGAGGGAGAGGRVGFAEGRVSRDGELDAAALCARSEADGGAACDDAASRGEPGDRGGFGRDGGLRDGFASRAALRRRERVCAE